MAFSKFKDHIKNGLKYGLIQGPPSILSYLIFFSTFNESYTPVRLNWLLFDIYASMTILKLFIPPRIPSPQICLSKCTHLSKFQIKCSLFH